MPTITMSQLRDKRPHLVHDDYEVSGNDFRDSLEFENYRKAILALLMNAPDGLTLGEIHRALGEDARREWTALALELLPVEDDRKYISRFKIQEYYAKEIRGPETTRQGRRTLGISINHKRSIHPTALMGE